MLNLPHYASSWRSSATTLLWDTIARALVDSGLSRAGFTDRECRRRRAMVARLPASASRTSTRITNLDRTRHSLGRVPSILSNADVGHASDDPYLLRSCFHCSASSKHLARNCWSHVREHSVAVANPARNRELEFCCCNINYTHHLDCWCEHC